MNNADLVEQPNAATEEEQEEQEEQPMVRLGKQGKHFALGSRSQKDWEISE
jgi:hypothetical protein